MALRMSFATLAFSRASQLLHLMCEPGPRERCQAPDRFQRYCTFAALCRLRVNRLCLAHCLQQLGKPAGPRPWRQITRIAIYPTTCSQKGFAASRCRLEKSLATMRLGSFQVFSQVGTSFVGRRAVKVFDFLLLCHHSSVVPSFLSCVATDMQAKVPTQLFWAKISHISPFPADTVNA